MLTLCALVSVLNDALRVAVRALRCERRTREDDERSERAERARGGSMGSWGRRGACVGAPKDPLAARSRCERPGLTRGSGAECAEARSAWRAAPDRGQMLGTFLQSLRWSRGSAGRGGTAGASSREGGRLPQRVSESEGGARGRTRALWLGDGDGFSVREGSRRH